MPAMCSRAGWSVPVFYWLNRAEAWAEGSALIAQYRLLAPAERTQEKRQELVAAIDALVLAETRGWGRRRRDQVRTGAAGATPA